MSPDAHLSLPRGRSTTSREWEKAAAAVLRKARRLAEDDPDDAVWDEAHAHRRSTGSASRPLGTPALVADLPDPVRPPARGDGWDVRALLADPDAAGLARRRPDRPRERRHLAVGPGRASPASTPATSPPCSTACSSTSRPSCSTPPRTPSARPARSPRSPRAPTLAAGTNLGVDPVGRRAARVVSTTARPPATLDRRRRRRLPRARRASSAAGRSWSTAPPCTTSAPPTCRSSATSLAARRPLPARARRGRGRRRRGRRGWSSSGSRPPTSSS